MENRLLIAYDIGTSGVKASVYEEDGTLVIDKTSGYDTFYDGFGGAEQEPQDWWEALKKVTVDLLKYVEIKNIACISFSGQESGLVLIDKDGNVLRKSMIHCDMRAVGENDFILSQIGDQEFFDITGHKASPGYTLEKMMWVKENEPDIYNRTYKILNAKDYIVFKITGEIMTDYTDASFTNFYDINIASWSKRLCELCGIDMEKLPGIMPSTHIAGYVSREISNAIGLPEGIPVIIGAGDGQCATIGCGAVKPGKTYNCLGSSSWITTILEKTPEGCGMCLETAAHPAGPWANSGGTMQTAGACWEWAVETFYPGEECKKIERELMETVPGASGVLFLPYLNGERVPFWDSKARGAFVGISVSTTRGDLIRAVLEGIAYNLKMILDVVQRYNQVDEITIFGGMAKNRLFCQILSEVYGIPVITLENASQITSLGAAIIGGVGAGIYDDFSVAERLCKQEQTFVPDKEHIKFYADKPHWLYKSYHALKEVFPHLSSYKLI